MKLTKKISLILFLSIGIPGTLHAQSAAGIGIKFGLNYANLAGGPYELSSRTGIYAGGSFEFNPESLPIGIESGIYYSQKGAEGQYKETIIKGAYEGNAGTFKLDYLEVPILAKYRFNANDGLKPYLIAGPYAEFNLNSEVKAIKNVAYIEDISAEIRSIGYGLIFGGGTDFEINERTFSLQVRYGLGLNPVYEGRSDEGEKHRVFTIAAGFVF